MTTGIKWLQEHCSSNEIGKVVFRRRNGVNQIASVEIGGNVEEPSVRVFSSDLFAFVNSRQQRMSFTIAFEGDENVETA